MHCIRLSPVRRGARQKGVKTNMKKTSAMRLLAFVLALVMVIGMCPALTFSAKATETETEGSSTVKIGAEVLLESEYWQEYLSGKNVALFTNQVCVDAQMNHLADKLAASEDINLVCLFGGEHGLRGVGKRSLGGIYGGNDRAGVGHGGVSGSGNESEHDPLPFCL